MWVLRKQKGGTGGGGGVTLQGDMHMVAARLGCERAIFSIGWATSRPNCVDRLRKLYSHLVVGFWQGRVLGL